MRRLMTMTVLVVVLMVLSSQTLARPHRDWRDSDFRGVKSYGYGYYRSRPVVQVGVGYGSYGYGYGYYPKNAQNSYPSGSLLSGLLGVSSYNEKEYWAYQNRLLNIGEKQSQQSGSSHPYISDPQLLEQAKQRGKLQHLEDADKRLQQENAELRKELSETKKMLQELLAEKGK